MERREWSVLGWNCCLGWNFFYNGFICGVDGGEEMWRKVSGKRGLVVFLGCEEKEYIYLMGKVQ